ncbi:hypothetical protein AK830_g10531 [Neonectria ditissima]|uniref:Rhodopsin domain-containing protein n=1 Tax=Neonectria ditissima TaxID=78410 RepID=A0A0P7B603_9HYPO|nr:hypothetical protein AK830_g10531 [Neonectria ditissima]
MYVSDIYVPPQNHALVGVGLTFTVLAALFVVLRIFTRLWLVRSMGVDDVFIVISTFGTLGFLIAVMEQVRYGLGEPPDPKLLSPFIQATVASVISYTVCHLAVKLSISIQCLRIFVTPAARRLFIGLIVFLSIYGTLCLLLSIITCWPVAKYWDDSIEGKCLDNRAMRYAFAGINIVNDIVLLIAPMPFLKGLQIARRVKIVLMGVFAAGGVQVPRFSPAERTMTYIVFSACIVAIIRLYSLWAYSSVSIAERPGKQALSRFKMQTKTVKVKGIDIAIWSGLECNIAIICACIPSLKPLSSRTFPGLVGSFAKASTAPSHGRYAHGNSHNYDNITHNTNSHNHSIAETDHRGIKMQQSFEMRTTTGSEDTDSEKNLVTGSAAAYHSQIYTSTEGRLPASRK